MNRLLVPGWTAAVSVVALLDILGVLPDWTTLTAALTLPFVLKGAPLLCVPRGRA